MAVCITVSKRTALPCVLGLGLILLISGCGYHNPYLAKTQSTDRPTIQAPIWKNNTNELGFEALLNNAIHDWLSESRFIGISNTATDAQYTLSGVIHSINIPGLSYGEYEQATELRAEIIFHYILREKSTNKVILEKKDQLKRQTFRVGQDAPKHRTNKEGALRIIADELAENIYMDILRKLTNQKRYQ